MKHKTYHYVDGDGNYLGGFGDGAEPPIGAVEVTAPNHGRDTWDGNKWTHYVPEPQADPDIEGAVRLLAVGHPNKAAIEALMGGKK